MEVMDLFKCRLISAGESSEVVPVVERVESANLTTEGELCCVTLSLSVTGPVDEIAKLMDVEVEDGEFASPALVAPTLASSML